MPTATPLTDAINALTTYANETTGQSDTTLSDAVGTLVAGYGGGGGGYTIDDIATGEPSGAITITVPTIAANAFIYNAKITSVTTNGTTQINGGAFQYCTELVTADLSGVTAVNGAHNMSYCSKLTTLLLPDLVTISNQAFRNCKLTGTLKLQNLTSGSGNAAFYGNTLLTKVYFFKKINISWQENLFNGCTGITDIYVPWSSGEVSGAPWGASNATVHYDTVYDENEEPIV